MILSEMQKLLEATDLIWNSPAHYRTTHDVYQNIIRRMVQYISTSELIEKYEEDLMNSKVKIEDVCETHHLTMELIPRNRSVVHCSLVSAHARGWIGVFQKNGNGIAPASIVWMESNSPIYTSYPDVDCIEYGLPKPPHKKLFIRESDFPNYDYSAPLLPRTDTHHTRPVQVIKNLPVHLWAGSPNGNVICIVYRS